MRHWDTNHAGYRDIFNAALTGVLANPHFYGPILQGSPEAAVGFADKIVMAAIQAEEAEEINSHHGSVYDQLLTFIHDRDSALRGDERTDAVEIDEAVVEIMTITGTLTAQPQEPV